MKDERKPESNPLEMPEVFRDDFPESASPVLNEPDDVPTDPAEYPDDSPEVPEGYRENYRSEKIFEEHKCILQDADRIAYGNSVSDLLTEIEILEVEKSEVAKKYKTRIDARQQRATEIAKILKAGFEMRSVAVLKEYDYSALTIRYIREDTGEELRSRDMNVDERQMTVFPGDSNNDPEHDPEKITFSSTGDDDLEPKEDAEDPFGNPI